MTSESPSYYAIIPANVRYDNNLSSSQKLLYGEISALCNKEGFCWASNIYFADLYGVKVWSISKWISSLEKNGYIKTGHNEKNQRLIHLQMAPHVKNHMGVVKNHKGACEKTHAPLVKKHIHNSIYNNTYNKDFEKSNIREISDSNEYLELIKAKFPDWQKRPSHIQVLLDEGIYAFMDKYTSIYQDYVREGMIYPFVPKNSS